MGYKMAFEYLVIEIEQSSDYQSVLCAYGAEGWELIFRDEISVHRGADEDKYFREHIFKRLL